MAKRIELDFSKFFNSLREKVNADVISLQNSLQQVTVNDKTELKSIIDNITIKLNKSIQSSIDKVKSEIKRVNDDHKLIIQKLTDDFNMDLTVIKNKETVNQSDIDNLQNQFVQRINNIPFVKKEEVEELIVGTTEEVIEIFDSIINSRIAAIKIPELPTVINGKNGLNGKDAEITKEVVNNIIEETIKTILQRMKDDWRFKSTFRGPVSEGGGCKISNPDNDGNAALIEVNNICFPDASTSPPNKEGCLYYDSTEDLFKYIDGTSPQFLGDHNLQKTLQGGTTDEYYHLNAYQYSFQDVVYEDLQVSLTSSKIGAATFQPTFEKIKDNGTGSRGVYGYHFNATAEQEVYFSIQLSHGRKLGTIIDMHIHVLPTTNDAGNVIIDIECNAANIDGTFGNTAVVQSIHAIPANSAFKHFSWELGDIDGTLLGMSAMIQCRLSRRADLGTDTYPGKLCIMQYDSHIIKDSGGSRQEYIK